MKHSKALSTLSGTSGPEGGPRSLVVRSALAVALAGTAAACAPSDYADGVSAFSQAITQTSTNEQALAAAEQQARLNQWIQQVGKSDVKTVSVDYSKCRAAPSAYHGGDCTVQWTGGNAPMALEPSSMTGLTKYAALLSSVVADTTCTALQTDATSLASSISDMAKDAKDTTLAAAASPLATITSTIGCIAIQDEQLAILKQATGAADPVVQKLVPIIADKDETMFVTVRDDDARQLLEAEVSYNASKSNADLARMVALAAAIDKAEQAPPGPAIGKLTNIHQTLTQDLAAPTVSLKRVQTDAQAFITDMQAVTSATQSLVTPAAPATPAKPKGT